MTTRDTNEMKLVSQIFDFVKGLAEWRLSEVALALFSAYILLQEGKNFAMSFCDSSTFLFIAFKTRDFSNVSKFTLKYHGFIRN